MTAAFFLAAALVAAPLLAGWLWRVVTRAHTNVINLESEDE